MRAASRGLSGFLVRSDEPGSSSAPLWTPTSCPQEPSLDRLRARSYRAPAQFGGLTRRVHPILAGSTTTGSRPLARSVLGTRELQWSLAGRRAGSLIPGADGSTSVSARPSREATARLDTRADGEQWAAEVREQTVADNRRVSGGWPGTLSEARARVARLAARLPHLDVAATEREEAARALYDSARAWWLLRQEKGRDDDE